MLRNSTKAACLSAFNEITNTGNIIVRGLIPHMEIVEIRPGVYVVPMRIDDVSTWGAYGSVLLLPIAVIPFHIDNVISFMRLISLSIVVTYINWKIGTLWVVALSRLTIPLDSVSENR
jgi:hypothetical protein